MKGQPITLQAEIGLFRQSIAEIGQFFLEPDNLRFWLLVTLSGYAVGLFTWAIDTNPRIVGEKFPDQKAVKKRT